METNKDLLLCENKYFLEKSKIENILDFNQKEKTDKPKNLQTERISSNVLFQVKSFLNKIKTDDPVCVNIEENDEEEEDVVDENEENQNQPEFKKKIQLDLLLFEQEESSNSSSDDDYEDDENLLN